MHRMRRSLLGRRQAGVPALALVWALAIGALVAPFASAQHPGCSASGFPRTVVDGLGREIFLAEPPQRIFSATLATDSILLSMVDPSRIVGVTVFAADPSYSFVADKVAGHMAKIEQLNAEVVLASRPDIVLVAFFNNQDVVRQMRDLGLKVYTFTGFSSVLDVIDNIERIGEITGCEAAAAAIVNATYERYGRVAAKIAPRPRPAVLYWDNWGSTAGSESTLHDIIQMAGGDNVAARHGITGWNVIDVESVVAMNPEVIITSYAPEFVQEILNNPALQEVPAVKAGRVYFLSNIDAPDHRIFDVIEELARLLHPEAFSEAFPEALAGALQ